MVCPGADDPASRSKYCLLVSTGVSAEGSAATIKSQQQTIYELQAALGQAHQGMSLASQLPTSAAAPQVGLASSRVEQTKVDFCVQQLLYRTTSVHVATDWQHLLFAYMKHQPSSCAFWRHPTQLTGCKSSCESFCLMTIIYKLQESCCYAQRSFIQPKGCALALSAVEMHHISSSDWHDA